MIFSQHPAISWYESIVNDAIRGRPENLMIVEYE